MRRGLATTSTKELFEAALANRKAQFVSIESSDYGELTSQVRRDFIRGELAIGGLDIDAALKAIDERQTQENTDIEQQHDAFDHAVQQLFSKIMLTPDFETEEKATALLNTFYKYYGQYLLSLHSDIVNASLQTIPEYQGLISSQGSGSGTQARSLEFDGHTLQFKATYSTSSLIINDSLSSQKYTLDTLDEITSSLKLTESGFELDSISSEPKSWREIAKAGSSRFIISDTLKKRMIQHRLNNLSHLKKEKSQHRLYLIYKKLTAIDLNKCTDEQIQAILKICAVLIDYSNYYSSINNGCSATLKLDISQPQNILDLAYELKAVGLDIPVIYLHLQGHHTKPIQNIIENLQIQRSQLYKAYSDLIDEIDTKDSNNAIQGIIKFAKIHYREIDYLNLFNNTTFLSLLEKPGQDTYEFLRQHTSETAEYLDFTNQYHIHGDSIFSDEMADLERLLVNIYKLNTPDTHQFNAFICHYFLRKHVTTAIYISDQLLGYASDSLCSQVAFSPDGEKVTELQKKIADFNKAYKKAINLQPNSHLKAQLDKQKQHIDELALLLKDSKAQKHIAAEFVRQTYEFEQLELPKLAEEREEHVIQVLQDEAKSKQNRKVLKDTLVNLKKCELSKDQYKQRLQLLSSECHRASRRAKMVNNNHLVLRLKQLTFFVLALPKRLHTGTYLPNKRSRTAYELRENTAAGSSVRVRVRVRVSLFGRNNKKAKAVQLFSAETKVTFDDEQFDLVAALKDCIHDSALRKSRESGAKSIYQDRHLAILYILLDARTASATTDSQASELILTDEQIILLAAEKLAEKERQDAIADATKGSGGITLELSSAKQLEITQQYEASREDYMKLGKQILDDYQATKSDDSLCDIYSKASEEHRKATDRSSGKYTSRMVRSCHSNLSSVKAKTNKELYLRKFTKTISEKALTSQPPASFTG